MLYIYPDYYKDFHCLAGDCPDTCCAGWQIMIDPKSLAKYKNTKGGFGNRLRNSIEWKEGSFLQYDGRCAFLNEDNLCDLYLEGGSDYFCKTCKNYPRHIEEFEGIRELSLSLSCPEAARIILSRQKPVHFLEKENSRTECYEDFDYLFFTQLSDTRKVLLTLLTNRSLPIHVRLAMMLSLCHDVQVRKKHGTLYTLDELLSRYQTKQCAGWFLKGCPGKEFSKDSSFFMNMLSLCEELETLKADWKPFLKELADFAEPSPKRKKETASQPRLIKNQSILEEQFPNLLEQLAVYFFFTYFQGAVYDGRVYAKGCLAVASTLFLEEIFKCHPEFSFNDMVSTACRYAREIEHSDPNLNAMEEAFQNKPAFQLKSMLAALLKIS